MASPQALEARIKALEDLCAERNARIDLLEKAVTAMDISVAEKDKELAVLRSQVSGGSKPAVGDCSYWTADKVRESFIEFFRDGNGHTFWPSSPCVPHDDPTLLFANAGMNQYKPLFLGQCDPALAMAKLKRATNSQKCIRAGGKKCDLDDVGKDVYHHTYFEMLGNWSFGDYFKEGAIKMTWECLTVKFGLDPERLYITYFGGDEVKAPGVPADEETRQIWLKYVPPERLLPFDAADNFWEMGDVGPCGPCTEIHYDRIGGRDAAALVNMDDPDVLEIWNNVFIQYNREPGGLKELPAQHVDTGMGFERLASVMQDKRSNYDTDVFAPLFEAIQKQTGAPPYTGKVGKDDVDNKDMAYRVLSDHIRALSFAITDGARPDSNERGYVLRRILRRAVYYGRFLGVKEGESFFYNLVDAVVDAYGHFFTELKPCRDKIVRVIKEEEELFNRTITAGMRLFNRKTESLLKEGKTVLPGGDAFLLSGSMGFPLDLTEIMAEQKGMTVNKEEYEACVEKDREASKAGAKSGGEAKDMVMMAKETSFLVSKNLPATDASGKYLLNAESTASVLAVYTGRGALSSEKGFVVTATPEDGTIGLVLDKTPFYAQQGGQTFDTGILSSQDGLSRFKVTSVQVRAVVCWLVCWLVAVQIFGIIACPLRPSVRPLNCMNHMNDLRKTISSFNRISSPGVRRLCGAPWCDGAWHHFHRGARASDVPRGLRAAVPRAAQSLYDACAQLRASGGAPGRAEPRGRARGEDEPERLGLQRRAPAL
jgi:alanyl-tRNA synthetase